MCSWRCFFTPWKVKGGCALPELGLDNIGTEHLKDQVKQRYWRHYCLGKRNEWCIRQLPVSCSCCHALLHLFWGIDCVPKTCRDLQRSTNWTLSVLDEFIIERYNKVNKWHPTDIHPTDIYHISYYSCYHRPGGTFYPTTNSSNKTYHVSFTVWAYWPVVSSLHLVFPFSWFKIHLPLLYHNDPTNH